MNVDFTIDGKRFVFREHLRSQLAVTLVCPIVFVKSAPKNGQQQQVNITYHRTQKEIRTLRLSALGSDFYCLVRMVGVEPTPSRTGS